jgi:FlaA1/EpsC-like NDP-sugar epimerase
MLLLDALLVVMCFYLAYVFRFEFSIPPNELSAFSRTWPYVLIVKMATFAFFRMYKGMWRYTSLVDLFNVIKAVFTSSLLIIIGVLMVHRFQGYPRSVFIIDGFLTFLAIGGIRVVIRLYFAQKSGVMAFPIPWVRRQKDDRKRLLIIGAGDAGEKALRELRDNPRLHYDVVAFIDDDSYKIGRSVHNIPVVDDLAGLNKTVETLDVDEVLIAIPSCNRLPDEADCRGLQEMRGPLQDPAGSGGAH